jgi:hypothetical protein
MSASTVATPPVAGRFLLEALAGAGGMGTVYRARDAVTGGTVALKLLQLLGQALRRLCGARDGETPEARRNKLASRIGERIPAAARARVIAFVGELCGAAFPDEDDVKLRAARQDPQIMSDQIVQATLDFLRAECAAHPTLLVLEDLQWGDALTVKLVDAALHELKASPLLVLALARPEVDDLFPRLWSHVRELDSLLLAAALESAGRYIDLTAGVRRRLDSERRLDGESRQAPPAPRVEVFTIEEQQRLLLLREHRFAATSCGRDPRYPGNRQTADLHLRQLACKALQAAAWDVREAAALLAGSGDDNLRSRASARIETFL